MGAEGALRFRGHVQGRGHFELNAEDSGGFSGWRLLEVLFTPHTRGARGRKRQWVLGTVASVSEPDARGGAGAAWRAGRVRPWAADSTKV